LKEEKINIHKAAIIVAITTMSVPALAPAPTPAPVPSLPTLKAVVPLLITAVTL